jgi:hypothetical protein
VSIDPIERKNLLFSAGAMAASFALLSPGFALSLGLGALLEAVNFRALRRTGEMLFSGEVPAQRFGLAGFASRFALLGLAIGVAIYVGAHPVGLVIGLSLIIPAAVIEAWRTRPENDPNAPVLDPDDEGWDLWNPWLARARDAADEDDDDDNVSRVMGIDLTADLDSILEDDSNRSQGENDR